MTIDLTDPAELDWLARGREGEISASRFSEHVSGEELEARVEDALVEAVARRLRERDFEDELALDDERDADASPGTARRVLDAVDDDRRERITREAWSDLRDSEASPQEFADSLSRRVADGLIEAYLEGVEGVGPGEDVLFESDGHGE